MTVDRSQVSGHYAGPVTRLLAFIADAAIVFIAFSLAAAGLALAVRIVTSDRLQLALDAGVWWVVSFVIWAFLYVAVGLGLAGRTPGKAIVGLRVVDREGEPLTPRQAIVRTMAFPLSFLLFGAGFLGILLGRERRALHDVIAGSAVVYDWGDRPAEIPAPLSQFLSRRGADVAPVTAVRPASSEVARTHGAPRDR